MVQADTAGQRDGRVAFWVEGKLIAHFPFVRFRHKENLKIDMFGIGLYLRPSNIHENKKWFYDLAGAASYIGPIANPKIARNTVKPGAIYAEFRYRRCRQSKYSPPVAGCSEPCGMRQHSGPDVRLRGFYHARPALVIASRYGLSTPV